MIRAFFRSPSGIAGSCGVLLILLDSIFAPIIWGKRAKAFNVLQGDKGPSGKHWLGTDRLGHDIFYQLLVATRLTMEMALGATAIAILVGIPLGAGAALLPQRLRMIALRGLDTLIAFPSLLIAIAFAAVLNPGKTSAVVGVGVGLSFSFGRVASSLTLAIRDREFISAARVVGVGRMRLLVRHVLPNIADSLAIATTVSIAASVVTMAGLSFLGLGVQLPSIDWGRMLTTGVGSFYLTPFAAIGPGVAIALAALAFGFVGEALARASNPVLWANAGGGTSPRSTCDADTERADDPHESDAANVLEVNDLTVSFPIDKRREPIVRGVALDLAPGEMIGIVGESGSGKSLTAMAIAQLIPHPGQVGGRIALNGKDLQRVPLKDVDRTLGTSLAVVFQDPMSSLNPAMKIRNQLIEGARHHRGLSKAEAVLAARRRLREVNLPTPERQLERYPHELSGGQRQRVLIAMGLMNEPSVLIADEPTTALDVTVQAQIMDLLAGINAEHGTAVILISHNLALIAQNCDRVLVMYAGRVVEEMTAEQLKTQALHPYTQALLGAVPDMSQPRAEPLVSIPGQMPDVHSVPAGCAFHTRCALAVERCSIERPPLLLQTDRHRVACWVATGEPSAELPAHASVAAGEAS
ncbi:MAG: peptide/nickel transport system ATP-binding protein [Pseudonocardiales bacterium]|jgi:oligopeptide/dipeptide ABC transporter ATP-binding protein|nr:peptide/nickel transport system ATP-binding protein [Pseudonocardiales bacterium]